MLKTHLIIFQVQVDIHDSTLLWIYADNTRHNYLVIFPNLHIYKVAAFVRVEFP